MLVLLDIDGTLVRAPSLIHAAAIEVACAEVFGSAVTVPEVGADAFNGLTTPALGRLVLERAGVEPRLLDERWAAWREAMIAAYRRLQASLPEQEPFADVTVSLDRIERCGARLGLLTGNYRAVAEAKLRAAGIWRPSFDLEQGAFADDALDRDELGRVARRRAAAAGHDELVVVGDTPRDIACARAARARALALTTGGFSTVELADADLVAPSLGEGVALLVAGAGPVPAHRPADSSAT